VSPDVCWPLGQGTHLRRLRLVDSAQLFRLVEANRSHLRRWMAWVEDVWSPTDVARFISDSQRVTERGPFAVECALEDDTGLLGAVGLNRIDWQLRTANVGYWLDAEVEGRGLATAAVRALSSYGVASLGLLRLEIRSTAENLRSRGVAERAGFVHEGTLRSATRLAGARRDLVIYGLLPSDLP
jgi:ribosomal-protein-serine acetyltransferase